MSQERTSLGPAGGNITLGSYPHAINFTCGAAVSEDGSWYPRVRLASPPTGSCITIGGAKPTRRIVLLSCSGPSVSAPFSFSLISGPKTLGTNTDPGDVLYNIETATIKFKLYYDDTGRYAFGVEDDDAGGETYIRTVDTFIPYNGFGHHINCSYCPKVGTVNKEDVMAIYINGRLQSVNVTNSNIPGTYPQACAASTTYLVNGYPTNSTCVLTRIIEHCNTCMSPSLAWRYYIDASTGAIMPDTGYLRTPPVIAFSRGIRGGSD